MLKNFECAANRYTRASRTVKRIIPFCTIIRNRTKKLGGRQTISHRWNYSILAPHNVGWAGLTVGGDLSLVTGDKNLFIVSAQTSMFCQDLFLF